MANINKNIQPALVLQNGRFNFSKTGVTDPLQQGISADERVEYQYRADEKKLYRLKYRNLNSSGRDQPESSVLLNDVDQFEIVVTLILSVSFYDKCCCQWFFTIV